MFVPPTIITSSHVVRDFDCGNRALNEYLAKYAVANSSAGIARTYVTTLANQPVVAGYFSIAAGSIERSSVPERVAKGTPQHPIPIALLARLAVDLKYQGQGIGSGMLKHALLKILGASEAIGIRAVLVHAKNRQAAEFYGKYGFVSSPINSLHMLLMMKDLIKTVES